MQAFRLYVTNFSNVTGVFIPPLSHTKEGYELQFGVNYLAHFKLTLMLLDVMMQSDSARIINVSSRAHKGKHNIYKTHN